MKNLGRHISWIVVGAVTFGIGPATAQTSEAPASSGIAGVIAAGATAEMVGSGYDSVECATRMRDGSFLFCQVEANRVLRVDPQGVISVYVENTNRSIGLGIDRKGRLISTQSRDPQLGELLPKRQPLADQYQGQPLVRPNDLIADARGGVYFSDPIPPAQLAFRVPPAGRRPTLFYLQPNRKLVAAFTSDRNFNGVALSPTGTTLYAVEGDQISAFRVRPDGGLTDARRFAANVVGDGLTIDDAGRLYVATRAGIVVLAHDGSLLGSIKTPTRVQNLAFAGKDRRTLYYVGAGSVYKIKMISAGVLGRTK